MVKGRLLNSYGYSDDDLEDMNFDLYAEDKSGIKFIRELCGLDKIVEQLENSVIGQKAKSILIDNGSEKVIELLKQVEGDLLVLEQTASDDQSKVEAELATAKDELAKLWILRRAMNGVPAAEAMELLVGKLKKIRTNIEFLLTLQPGS